GVADVLAFSPDGKKLASGGWDRTMRLWGVATGKEVGCLRRGYAPRSLAFGPKGKTLIAACGAKTDLWDLTTKKMTRALPVHDCVQVGFDEKGRAVAVALVWPRDRRTLPQRAVAVHDIETGKRRFTFEGHTKGVMWLVISPDRKVVASGGEDETVRLWSLS